MWGGAGAVTPKPLEPISLLTEEELTCEHRGAFKVAAVFLTKLNILSLLRENKFTYFKHVGCLLI